MAGEADVTDKIISCALNLGAERGWRRVGFADIAAAANVPLVDIYRRFPCKLAILGGYSRRLDEKVLAGTAEAAAATNDNGDDSIRDRLFDVLMRRFDAMQPDKEGLAAVLTGMLNPPKPLAFLCGGANLLKSMAWSMEAAGVNTAGLMGIIGAKGLAIVYLRALRAWFDDDSPDLAHTMAILDDGLRRAEDAAKLLARAPFARSEETADEAARKSAKKSRRGKASKARPKKARAKKK